MKRFRLVALATCALAISAVGACGTTTFSGSGTEDGGFDASSRDVSVEDANGGSDAIADSAPDVLEIDSGLPAGTVVLASSQANPNELVVRGGNLYWTNFAESTSSPGSIMTVDTNGTGLAKVADAVHANRLAIDDDQIYWSDVVTPNTTASSFYFTPLDGGASTIVTGIVAPMDIATNDDVVLATTTFGFAGAGVVLEMDKQGNILEDFEMFLSSPVAVAVDDRGAAWSELGLSNPGGSISFTDLDASPEGQLTGLSVPWAIALSGDFAYYTTAGAFDASAPGAVSVAPRDGGAALQIATSSARPYFLAVDATAVYWTEEGTGPTNGLVRWAKKSDHVPHDFAIGQARPHGIAVDASFIYWTSYATGNIYRAPLPR